MIVRAYLKSTSAIHRLWKGKSQLGGVVGLVHFRWRGNRFETDDLDPVELNSVKLHPDVELEMFGVEPKLPQKPPVKVRKSAK